MDSRGNVFEAPVGVDTAQGKVIHLSRPGGEQEGPYSLEQINEGLASGRLQGSDYWAWYQGLTQWVPLYSVPGVSAIPQVPKEPVPGYDAAVLTPASIGANGSAETHVTQAVVETVPAESVPVNSGLPFTALEQVFILTTGEAQAASRSPATISLLQEVIGEDWTTIRSVVPRDAIGKCTVLADMGKGPVPPLVWRAMTAFKPNLLQQARDGLHRICIRTFQIETGDTVSVFLFYNKEKMK